MLIEARALTKRFHCGNGQKLVNDGIDLTVAQGDFIGLKGKSGCGKSTLLNMLCGMIHPSSGEVLYDGEALANKSDREISRLRNAKIGYVMQDVCLLPNFTVLDNVLLPAAMFAQKQSGLEERAEKLLERVGIAWAKESYPHELSGGEMRRAALARALINQPSVLVLDEATNDLDEETEGEIMQMVLQMNREGLTILMVSHRSVNIDFARTVYQMQDGKICRMR